MFPIMLIKHFFITTIESVNYYVKHIELYQTLSINMETFINLILSEINDYYITTCMNIWS